MNVFYTFYATPEQAIPRFFLVFCLSSFIYFRKVQMEVGMTLSTSQA